MPNSFEVLESALKSDNYPLYKDVLQTNLDKVFGDNKINVTRIEGDSDPFTKNKVTKNNKKVFR